MQWLMVNKDSCKLTERHFQNLSSTSNSFQTSKFHSLSPQTTGEVWADEHVMLRLAGRPYCWPAPSKCLCLHTCSPTVCINYLILLLIERSIIVRDEYQSRNLPLKNLLIKGNLHHRTTMLLLLLAHVAIYYEHRTDYSFVRLSYTAMHATCLVYFCATVFDY